MTATLLPGVRGYVYCVSAAGTAKVSDMLLSDKVAWSFQSASLDRVVSLTGRAAVIDSPELKARVLESLGKNLVRFWRLCPDPKKLVVIETAIDHASLYYPADNAAFEAEDLL
jgi:hypothetical protein